MERLERDPRDGRGLEFAFSTPQRSGRVIFELHDGRVEVGGDGDGDGNGAGATAPVTLLEHAEMWLERGEHVSLVGPNGAGKTTLVEVLAGRRELPAGKLSVGHNVKVGYLSQHAEELGAGGPPEQTVVEAAQRATGLTPNKARALLGRFLFSGEEAEKPLAGLSGGERRRLSLAVLVGGAHPPNVLILDEPTNHLDIESREALEDALRAFPGAILLVSHDRALLDAVGTRTVAVEDGTLHTYLGGWAEYARTREDRLAAGQAQGGGDGAARPSLGGTARNGTGNGAVAGAGAEVGPAGGGATAESRAKAKRGAGKPKGPSKNRLSAQQKAEADVEAAEASLSELEAELSQPEAWATRYESAKSEARHTAARRAVEAAYDRLQSLSEES